MAGGGGAVGWGCTGKDRSGGGKTLKCDSNTNADSNADGDATLSVDLR